jgi:cation:H+ antiporter
LGVLDIAVGNIVGSNIFIIVAVLGIAALVAPAGIKIAACVVLFDFPVMFAGGVG